MPRARLTTWSPGLDSVHLIKLVRSSAGLPLNNALDLVNRFLAGEPVELNMPDISSAEELVQKAHGLGVGVEILDVQLLGKN